jgi:hypothetical protein
VDLIYLFQYISTPQSSEKGKISRDKREKIAAPFKMPRTPAANRNARNQRHPIARANRTISAIKIDNSKIYKISPQLQQRVDEEIARIVNESKLTLSTDTVKLTGGRVLKRGTERVYKTHYNAMRYSLLIIFYIMLISLSN